jgi:hypothetical protein
MRRARSIRGLALAGLALAASLAAAPSGQTTPERATVERVQTALEQLPYYGVFDFLAFSLDRGTATLYGYAYRGSLKAEATRAVKRLPGIDTVIDRIELLPASQADDAIRWATYATIYGDGQLTTRYLPGNVPTRHDFNRFARFPNMQPVGMYPIHIVVNRLRTTLLGTVDSEMDRTYAALRAQGVPGVLKVDVDIAVVKRMSRR